MADGTEANQDAAFTQFWLDQLDGYNQEFKRWEKRSERIVKRYRDERQELSDGRPDYSTKFNALWSNVQTLLPAVYKTPPQPVVDRRYLDKDRIARYASMTLERALEVTIEECGFHQSTRMSVQDYLLPGRGTIWHRYEPTYGTPEELGPTATDDEGQATPKADREADDENPAEPAEAPRPVTWEKVYQDYVGWKNFRHSPAATWEEVWWVAKREFMSRRELRTRFGKAKGPNGEVIAEKIPLQEQNFKDWDDGGKEKPKKGRKTAAVWEIWDKNNREVVFIAEGYPLAPLERTPDPLSLQNFWPCAKPLYATLTNDCLVPVPDYAEYQDQAEELDSLSSRIKALTDAVRVNGVYDASIPELKRILQEGADNRLIGVAKWSEFSARGGLEGAMDFIPLKDVVEALVKLQESFEVVKRRMDEITGISDIVRGQSSGAAKTATEQKIKSNYATLRLEDRQGEVARFCRDNLAIAAEIISEQFSPEILAEMTGMLTFIREEIASEAQPPQSPPMQPGQGPDGGQQDPAQMQAMQQQQEQQIEQAAQQLFTQAIELLKNDKMRTFRIDIETDSTVAIDDQAEKEGAIELVTALGGFLESAAAIGQTMPEVVPALGQTLLFAFRRFRVGRDVEGAWEQFVDKITQKAKNPPPQPPSPEEVKAKAEQEKQQMESQRQQQQAQIDQQQAAMDMQAEQQKHALELQKMQAEIQMQREEMQMMREKMGMEMQAKREDMALDREMAEQQFALDTEAMNRDAEFGEVEHERNLEAGERKHELDMETAEFKAKQAKQKPRGEKK